MERLKRSIDEHAKLFDKIVIQPEDIDYEKAKREFIPFLRLIDSLQTSIVVAFDFYKRDYFYCSEKFNSIFGFCKNSLPKVDHKWVRSRFHPEDYIINTGSMMALKIFYQQPVENRKNLRLIHEFRMKNDDNKWIRLMVQNDIMELDRKGNMWLDLKLWDFSPVQDLEAPGRFLLRNKLSGKILLALEGCKLNGLDISSREKEILSMIAGGMQSKEIAEKLFISVNTVNNHRRNLIKKLNVSNSSGAIMQAMKLGII